jgi:hypothetical protein
MKVNKLDVLKSYLNIYLNSKFQKIHLNLLINEYLKLLLFIIFLNQKITKFNVIINLPNPLNKIVI